MMSAFRHILRHILPIKAILRHALPAFLCLLAPTACLQEGTESGTETGIQGRISREGEATAPGAEVYAFRTESLEGAGASIGDSAVLLRILENPDTLADARIFARSIADSRGRFRHAGLAPGYYSVVGFHEDALHRGKWVGFLPTVKVTPSAMTDAGDLLLRRMGGIIAMVTHKGRPAENVKCHIPGLSFVAYSDGDGRCMLLHVPEGSHTLGFEHADYVAERRGPVAVESGKIASLSGAVDMVRNPAGTPPAPRNPRVGLDPDQRVVTLSWDSVDVSDLAGYILFRKPSDSLSAILEIPLHNNLIRGREYRDTLYESLPDTAEITYVYKLLAVDVDGNRSMPAVFTPLQVPASAHPIRIRFAAPAYPVREGDSAAVAWIRRIGPANRPVKVRWELRDSTAARDSDYVPMSGETSFAAGDSLMAIRAALVDDDRIEPAQAFTARLLSADNGAVLADPRQTAFNVQDDDSLTVLRCSQTTYAVGEGDSSFAVAIRVEGDRSRKGSVKYAAVGSTAKEGVDFLAASGALSVGGGMASLRIPIRPIDDTVEERRERLILRLSEPSADMDLSLCPDIAVDVVDDDTDYVPAPVDFTRASASHDGFRIGPNGFPGALYNGDTAKEAITEYKTTNADLAPKPAGHWDFQDCGKPAIADRSGNGHDGASQTSLGCKSDADGAWAQFSGDDSVVVPDHPALNFRQQFTAAAWVKPGHMAGRHTLVAKMYAPTSFGLELVDGQYTFNVVIADGTYEGNSFTIAATADSGVWTHVAGTYDGNVQRLYVNGEVMAEQSLRGAMQITWRPIVIGNHPEWSAFQGGIREIKVFGQGLSAYQIWELMRAATMPPKPFSVTFAFPAPVTAMGAGAVIGSAMGTTRYRWMLAGADSMQDLDGKTGSYAVLGSADQQPADTWSEMAFKPRPCKLYRYSFIGTAGTGYIQINELSLSGAERVKLPD